MRSKYTTSEIERIISEGSVKKKLRLFIRDRMGYFGQGFIMTYSQINDLILSVDPMNRREWEEAVSFALRYENGFKDMSRSLERIKQRRENLLRTLLEIQDFEKLEEMMNKLIDPSDPHLWDSVGEPNSILEQVSLSTIIEKQIPSVGFNLVRPTLDSSNHIDLNLSTGEGSLKQRANREKNLLRREMWFYMCYEVAMRQRLSESKFTIPEYEELLTLNRQIIEEPVSMSLRWAGVQDNRTYQIGECDLKDKDPQEFPYPSIRELIEDYSVRETDIDLEDQESIAKIKDIYKQI